MLTTTLTNSDSTLTIHYNDKTVQIEPDKPLRIKWINGKNGLKSAEQKKHKYLNTDLPTVSFRHAERLPKAGMARPFKMPTSYVLCNLVEEESGEETEYDLDREDIAWLQLANVRRREAGHPSIDENILEIAIDLLEKESHFQFTQDEHGYGLGYLTMIDNDAPCCICNDGEDSNANQIIFCDICNMAVHQECYGVPYIPEGQWLCRRCQLSPSIPVNCALCPCTSGAFKQTSDGRWAHVVCAIWLNEVHFANTVFLEPVEGVTFSIKRRHKLTCLICKRKVGACLQCSNKACVRSFHATCARYAGMKMIVKESRARNDPDSVTVNRFAYCFHHSNPNRNGQTVAAWKREMENNLCTARKQIDLSAKQTLKLVPMPVIPKEKVQLIAHKLHLNYMDDIYSYWSLKRKSRLGVPLVRRLQVYMNQQKPLLGRSFDDQSAAGIVVAEVPAETCLSLSNAATIVEQTRESTTVIDPLKHFAGLRRNFERVRLLCELVKKREKMKRDQLLTTRAIVSKSMRPLAVLIEQTLAKLIEKDHQKVFIEAVTEKQVPGYSSTISRPMDFHQMRSNVDKGRYKRISELRDDFLLIIRNCTTFNKNNTHFYNYGQRIKRIGISVLKAAEFEEQRLNELSNMAGFVLEFPTLSSEAFFELSNEIKLHNNMSDTEIIADKTTRTAAFSEASMAQQQESNNNKQRASSSFLAGKATIFMGRKAITKKYIPSNSTTIAKYDINNSTILSEREKKDKTTTRLKRSHIKAGMLSLDGKCNTTSIAGEVRATPDDTEQHDKKQKKTTKKRGRITSNFPVNIDNNEHSKALSSPSAYVHHQQQLAYDKDDIKNSKLHSAQRKCTDAAMVVCTRGVVRKQNNYANSYQTEASSAAESDSSQCLFSSIPEEQDDLPSTMNFVGGKTLRRRRQIPVVSKKYLEADDDFVPPSPTSTSFSHNDIVWVHASKIPGRVIDIRMRAIDLEDEEDDDDYNAVIGRSNNYTYGVGRHFIDHALLTKPTQIETGRQQHTLILFFDKNNTCKWVPNNQIRLLYEGDLNNKTLTEKDHTVVEAFGRALRFWKDVINF